MGMMILAATRGCSTEEVYSLVDTHMGDSVQHNKGINVILQELYSLETPAGQLFCGTHTTLGFAAGINKMLRNLEAEMKIEQVLKGFMVDLEVDSKNSSLAGQALDICLKLVAGEYIHQPWNRYKEFQLFLQHRGVFSPLFAYKDSRFGCLSLAAAVLLHIYPHLLEYLDQNPGVNNRLACLARGAIPILSQDSLGCHCFSWSEPGRAILRPNNREGGNSLPAQAILQGPLQYHEPCV